MGFRLPEAAAGRIPEEAALSQQAAQRAGMQASGRKLIGVDGSPPAKVSVPAV
jgi:hypothetical protein